MNKVEAYIQLWNLAFNFLIAIKWPLTIIIMFLIIRRSFKKLKEDVTKATVNKLINDKNKKEHITGQDVIDQDVLRS